jgi:hypothetical protein
MKDEAGWTATDVAMLHRRTDVVNTLADAGAASAQDFALASTNGAVKDALPTFPAYGSTGGWRTDELDSEFAGTDTKCGIDERTNLTASEFFLEYWVPGKPVIMRGAAHAQLPGVFDWTQDKVSVECGVWGTHIVPTLESRWRQDPPEPLEAGSSRAVGGRILLRELRAITTCLDSYLLMLLGVYHVTITPTHPYIYPHCFLYLVSATCKPTTFHIHKLSSPQYGKLPVVTGRIPYATR